MTDEEKKAIEWIKCQKGIYIYKIIVDLIEKYDKIINEMADRLEFVMKNSGIGLATEHRMNFTINDIKEYFEKKVGE